MLLAPSGGERDAQHVLEELPVLLLVLHDIGVMVQALGQAGQQLGHGDAPPVCRVFRASLPFARATRKLGSGGYRDMRIEIICTGDEVLTGKIVNTNFSYMAQKLEDVGLSVHWGTTVGDDRDSLLQAFLHAGGRADAVIVNGGLGPTVDDLSQEVAAQAAGVELGTARGMAGAHGGVFLPPRAQHAAEQPQAGDAAGRRGDAGQSDRHRLRLRDGHRPCAVLLHPGRAARAAADAGGTDHPATAGAQRGADRDLSQALPFLRAGRIACRSVADRR